MYHRCNRVNIQHTRTFVIYKVIKVTLLHKVQICFAAGNVIEHLKSLTIRLISKKKIREITRHVLWDLLNEHADLWRRAKKVGLT